MRKLIRWIIIIVVICVLCGGFAGMLKRLGCTDEQIGKAEQIVDNVKDKLSDGMDVVSDQLGQMILGSDAAYSAGVQVYAKTRRAERYDTLDEQAVDYDEKELDETTRLCRFTSFLGKENSWYTDAKNPYEPGGDTWYAFGRFGEDNGVSLADLGQPSQWLNNAEAWAREVYETENPDADPSRYTVMDGYQETGVFVSRGAEKIYPHAVAVCDGHVLYIEDVHFVGGEPREIYFSEADGKGQSGALDDWDGVLQEADYEEFLAAYRVLGYIVPMNIFT